MLLDSIPKLPMRNRVITQDYYVNTLGFTYRGSDDFSEYLIVEKDAIQIHFFEFKDLDPQENYGQVYIRTDDIDTLYVSMIRDHIAIHPNGALEVKPWGQKEFSLLDPDNNLLIFGKSVETMS